MGDAKPPESGKPVPPAEETKPKTCLDCGFLTIEGGQASPADRILLQTLIRRRAGNHNEPSQADLTLLYNNADLQDYSPQCSRGQWIDYDLSPYANRSKEIFNELTEPRQECLYVYIPGLSAAEHLKLQIEGTISTTNQPPPSPRKPDRKTQTRGRPIDKETAKRREILHQMMQDPSDLKDPEKRKALFKKLEQEQVPIPGDENRSTAWTELLAYYTPKPKLDKVRNVLREDFYR